jgi:DNA-binding IclR family transcriptional regulator
MIQPVMKSLDMLELLAEEPERRYMLAEIAARTGLKLPSAAKVLQTLVERGYVEQAEAKKGYRLGRMVSILVSRVAHRADIGAVAEPLVRLLAGKTGGRAMVVTMFRGRRFVVCEVDGGRGLRINGAMTVRGNVYRSAADRVLLAYQSIEEIQQFVKQNGRPTGESWPQATTEAGMWKEFGKIKAQKAAIVEATEGVTGLGLPLWEGEKVVAALGLFVPTLALKGLRPEEILVPLRETAGVISKKLTGEVQKVKGKK